MGPRIQQAVATYCNSKQRYRKQSHSQLHQPYTKTGQGVAGNMGMYAMGVPAGILVDHRGPRLGVLVGAIALAVGYFPIHTGIQPHLQLWREPCSNMPNKRITRALDQ